MNFSILEEKQRQNNWSFAKLTVNNIPIEMYPRLILNDSNFKPYYKYSMSFIKDEFKSYTRKDVPSDISVELFKRLIEVQWQMVGFILSCNHGSLGYYKNNTPYVITIIDSQLIAPTLKSEIKANYEIGKVFWYYWRETLYKIEPIFEYEYRLVPEKVNKPNIKLQKSW